MTSAREHLRRLVAFPTVSSDTNLDCIAYCREVLEAAGARCETQLDATGQKANLWATFGPEGDGGLILSGHVDVVPVDGQDWSSDPWTLTERDGRLYGRGTCDMKGFVACVLAEARAFVEAKTPIYIALTYDEEIGLYGARALVEHLKERGLRPDLAIIGEPTDMGVIEGHKGCNEYIFEITGLEGHGSRTDLGVNAGVAAARIAVALSDVADEVAASYPANAHEPPWPTCNIGEIHAGTTMNVIPGQARLGLEMRLIEESDADLIVNRVARWAEKTLLPPMRARHPGADITMTCTGESPPFLARAENPARDLLLRLTGHNDAGLVSYCTEAGVWCELDGLSAAICGPGSILQAHKPDEYVTPEQLEACSALLRRLARELS